MPEIVLGIISWIANNPQIILQGIDRALKMIDDVVAIYRRWAAGTMTEAERDAAWKAAGVDMQAVRDHWRQRHPVVEPTSAGSGIG